MKTARLQPLILVLVLFGLFGGTSSGACLKWGSMTVTTLTCSSFGNGYCRSYSPTLTKRPVCLKYAAPKRFTARQR